MTQTDATDPPEKRSPRFVRPSPGTTVHRAASDEKGIVTASDDWWDTLQLPGVPISSQVLVEWPRSGHPVRRWELIGDLTVDTGEDTE